MDFSKWDDMFDIEGLNADALASSEFESVEVPAGTYEVSLEKLELKETKKTGLPMLSAWFKILSGDYKGQMIFYNQVIQQGFGLRLANEIMRKMVDDEISIKLKNWKQYVELIEDVKDFVDSKGWVYSLKYGQNKKGYSTYEILEIFED